MSGSLPHTLTKDTFERCNRNVLATFLTSQFAIVRDQQRRQESYLMLALISRVQIPVTITFYPVLATDISI